MIQEDPQRGLESRLALNRVMQDKGQLSEQESEKNIADNLVVVAGFEEINKGLSDGSLNIKGKAGTGLLLTTDGFILTAYHNIQAYVDDWKRISQENPPTHANLYTWMEEMKQRYAIVDQKRNAYPIDTSFWSYNPTFDLALIKAVILKEPEPIEFGVIGDNLEVGDEIKLFALRDQRQYNQYGTVTSTEYDASINHPETREITSTTLDTFLTDAYGVPGFSGGVFTNLHGEFAGLALYITVRIDRAIGYVGGAKARNIVDFVKDTANKVSMAYKDSPARIAL